MLGAFNIQAFSVGSLFSFVSIQRPLSFFSFVYFKHFKHSTNNVLMALPFSIVCHAEPLSLPLIVSNL